MKFNMILRLLLEERGITQKELAARLNLAPSTMGSYVQGIREPDFETLKKLAEYFHTTTDYLLDFHTDVTADHQEADLLRLFRSLDSFQRRICLEQCRVFVTLSDQGQQKK